ncbi:MAG: DegT/DnrJ/EryC1/StrS family aminotransferase [Bacilli bacterium]|nr:DegT/DnrJ/EryC1/StrS family aminotransferase [Bacilli bacterium]
MAIQVLKPKFHVEECLKEIRECLEKGWTGMGFKTVQFEEEWKKYTGHKYAYYLNSNTVGLHLAFKILKMRYNWKDGDEVITTPITFVSTNLAILYENLKPVFADVDDELCLDPEDVERKITNKTRAIIFVGYGGRVGQLKKILEIAKKHNLRVVLDAAHMSGTRYDGSFPGTWEGVDVAVYSYQAVKNLATGDSGCICWNDPESAELNKQLAWCGINKDTYARSNKGTYAWKYDVDYVGYKYNGNAIMASIALTQLKYLDQENERRREIVKMYNEGFKNNSKIKIIPANHPEECCYHLYELAVPDREALLDYLSQFEINCGVHYRDNTEYSIFAFGHGSCPKAHEISQHLITMPLHMWLTDEDVQLIIKKVNEFVK